MSAMGILDVVIGLAFVYLLLSLICSVINEWIAALFNRRPRNLKKGIEDLLGSETATKFFDHALIQTKTFGSKIPAYVPSWTFAKAALDLVRQQAGKAAGATLSLQDVQNAIGALKPEFQNALAPLAATAKNIEELQDSMERWYNESMDRVSGIYKRWNMLILVILSLVVSVTVNADTFALGKLLWTNPALRESTVEAAKEHIRKATTQPVTQPTTQPSVLRKELEATRKELDQLNLGLGWGKDDTGGLPPCDQQSFGWWAWKTLGLLFTTAAVSLGAPFWFDTLNKIMRFRSAVKPEEPQKEKK